MISEYADDKSSKKGTSVRYKRAGAEANSKSQNRQIKITKQPVANTTATESVVSSTSFKKTKHLLLKFTDVGSDSR